VYVGRNIAPVVWRKRDTGDSLHTATVDINSTVVYKTVKGQRLPPSSPRYYRWNILRHWQVCWYLAGMGAILYIML